MPDKRVILRICSFYSKLFENLQQHVSAVLLRVPSIWPNKQLSLESLEKWMTSVRPVFPLLLTVYCHKQFPKLLHLAAATLLMHTYYPKNLIMSILQGSKRLYSAQFRGMSKSSFLLERNHYCSLRAFAL